MAELSGYITLDEAKDQVAVEISFSGHDALLTRILKASEKAAIQFLNIDSLDDLIESPADSPAAIPEDVKCAILLNVEALFDRDMTNFDKLCEAAERLLWPYRQGLGV
jgi:hypothetical protein